MGFSNPWSDDIERLERDPDNCETATNVHQHGQSEPSLLLSVTLATCLTCCALVRPGRFKSGVAPP